jgi:hypothetical protein
MAVASRFSSVDNSIAPTRDAVPSSGGGESGAIRPSVSTVVLMSTSDEHLRGLTRENEGFCQFWHLVPEINK